MGRHRSDRPTVDAGRSRRHRQKLFQESAAPAPRHLDLRIWFNALRIERRTGDEVPLQEFIDGGVRWWGGLHAGDPRTGETASIQPVRRVVADARSSRRRSRPAMIYRVSLWDASAALAAGLLVAVITTPVGVSGAVFLLPIQLDLLRVPSPAVTPTNLTFNVISTPGAILRHQGTGSFSGGLARQLLLGTLPGVVAGTLIRVFIAPGDREFRLLAAAVLFPLGIMLCLRRDRPSRGTRTMRPWLIASLGLVVGTIGGIYGIGGGSLIGPILVATGMSVATVAPAALMTTFVTSVVGVAAYGLLALTVPGPVGPDWLLGTLCGIGGLCGGYLGARLQRHIPERALRALLGILAVGLAATYVVQATRY